MSSYWKAFIAGIIWTAAEALAATLSIYMDGDINWRKVILATVIAVLIFIGKTLKIGFPEVDPAQDDDAYIDDVEPADEELEEDEDEA